MKQRCDYVHDNSFQHYGKRFISYDPAWKYFENFLSDMGERPEGMTLDRIDPNLDYTKDNCRWTDDKTQQRNRRNNLRVTYNGEKRVLSEWAEITGINYETLYARLVRLGWPPELAFSTPSQSQIEMMLTFDGRTMTTADWSRETGISNKTIRYRIKMLGWPVELALTTPAKPRTKK